MPAEASAERVRGRRKLVFGLLDIDWRILLPHPGAEVTLCVVDAIMRLSVVLAPAMVVERVETHGKLVGADVELHADRLAP